MTQDERTEICSTCKNRSFSIKEGLLCKKTMEKPCFDTSCEDYEKDADEVKKQEQFANELKESDKISGFLAFYVYWAIPIGILMTIIGFFVTPTSLADYNYSLGFLLFDVVWIALYLYFSIYTIYAFVKRKSDAVFIAKWTLALIVVTNLLPILTDSAGTGVFNNTSRLISSCVWCVVFFLYLTLSEDVKDCIPKETRRLGKRNKVIVILSVVLPVLLLAGGFVELVARDGQLGLLASERTKYEIICNETKAALPMDVGDELTWFDIKVNEGEIEYVYRYKDEAFSIIEDVLSEDYNDLLSKIQAESIKIGLVERMGTGDDELFIDLAKTDDYGVRYTYNSPANECLYTILLTNEELKAIYSTSSYTTSVETFQSLLDSFNKLLPIEYFADCHLKKCTLSDDGTVLHYHLNLVGFSKKQLANLTHDFLTNHITQALPYLTDAPYLLSQTKKMDISFDFTADCSDTWKSSVLIKGE